ncbi:MAG: sodium ion-translocating decarboxylase subunit beta [Christensenellaceae bacterium]|jgi:oxaloacetate decarboxylase beta subunit|nr:sodium ion-translocating decarboxylase subunit beta [Christensenellaceae bacterium]
MVIGINIGESIGKMFTNSGYASLFDVAGFTGGSVVMIIVACVFLFLAIVKKFEPLLLLPIAFGILLANLPLGGLTDPPLMENGSVVLNDHGYPVQAGGLLYYLYQGVKLGIYPCLIFLGIGAMTDFGPLLSRPVSLILGAGAQFGIIIAFIVATLFGFQANEAASIAIIGGADGPTAIFLTNKLAPHLLAPIAVAAYSYMALIPLIQPPLMRLMTTKNERMVIMKQSREVKKIEKIIFPIAMTIVVILLLPDVAPLIGCLMLGNLFRESGVVGRLTETSENALINIVTIFLGLTVGATATAETFLTFETLKIIALGLFAFCFSTIGGLLFGKLLYVLSKGKINPLIGSAGVSAVPMAARVSQVEGAKYRPGNFLLMHAMGPNVAGVIGSAVAAGLLLTFFG